MIKSYCRGHEIIRINGIWIFADTKKPCWGKEDKRPCKRCGKTPTSEGYDACLGYIDNVSAACCGHGVIKGWITKKC